MYNTYLGDTEDDFLVLRRTVMQVAGTNKSQTKEKVTSNVRGTLVPRTQVIIDTNADGAPTAVAEFEGFFPAGSDIRQEDQLLGSRNGARYRVLKAKSFAGQLICWLATASS